MKASESISAWHAAARFGAGVSSAIRWIARARIGELSPSRAFMPSNAWSGRFKLEIARLGGLVAARFEIGESYSKPKGNNAMANQTDTDTGETTYQEREAVAIFGDEASLIAAVDALMQAGWRQDDMSILGHADRVGELQARAAELADRDDVPRAAYVSPDSAVEGLAATVAGPAVLAGLGATAIVTSGGLALLPTIAFAAGGASVAAGIGLLFARAFGRRHAAEVQAQILNGGLLLWVRAREAATDETLLSLLRSNGGRNVHMHTATRHWGVDDTPFHDAEPDPLLR